MLTFLAYSQKNFRPGIKTIRRYNEDSTLTWVENYNRIGYIINGYSIRENGEKAQNHNFLYKDGKYLIEHTTDRYKETFERNEMDSVICFRKWVGGSLKQMVFYDRRDDGTLKSVTYSKTTQSRLSSADSFYVDNYVSYNTKQLLEVADNKLERKKVLYFNDTLYHKVFKIEKKSGDTLSFIEFTKNGRVVRAFSNNPRKIKMSSEINNNGRYNWLKTEGVLGTNLLEYEYDENNNLISEKKSHKSGDQSFEVVHHVLYKYKDGLLVERVDKKRPSDIYRIEYFTDHYLLHTEYHKKDFSEHMDFLYYKDGRKVENRSWNDEHKFWQRSIHSVTRTPELVRDLGNYYNFENENMKELESISLYFLPRENEEYNVNKTESPVYDKTAYYDCRYNYYLDGVDTTEMTTFSYDEYNVMIQKVHKDFSNKNPQKIKKLSIEKREGDFKEIWYYDKVYDPKKIKHEDDLYLLYGRKHSSELLLYEFKYDEGSYDTTLYRMTDSKGRIILENEFGHKQNGELFIKKRIEVGYNERGKIISIMTNNFEHDTWVKKEYPRDRLGNELARLYRNSDGEKRTSDYKEIEYWEPIEENMSEDVSKQKKAKRKRKRSNK